MLRYKRILLKLSGESLSTKSNYGIDVDKLEFFCKEIAEIVNLNVEVAIVIGGGNIFRGITGLKQGFDRYKGDYMGMLATVINSMAIESQLNNIGIKAKLFTSFNMQPVGEQYNKDKCIESLKNKNVILLAGGTGNPYFTTDTAASLRAIEIEAEVLIKGTRVDGVYSSDPEKDIKAVKFDEITFDEAYKQNLKIMDLTAFTLCKENNMPVIVFNMNTQGNLKKIILGEKIGTLVKN
jgi:uridylate kinase